MEEGKDEGIKHTHKKKKNNGGKIMRKKMETRKEKRKIKGKGE